MKLLPILFLSNLFLGSLGHAQQSITLTYENADSYPWSMKDGTGINFILLNLVDEALPDVKFEYNQAPWKRCFINIEHNRTQGCFAASYEESRLKFGHYPGTDSDGEVNPSLRLHSSSYSVYALKGAGITVTDKMTISGLTGNIASPAGYSIGQDLKTAGYSVDSLASKTTHNFSKLIAGRIQAVAALTLNGNKILTQEKKFSEKIEKLNPPLINKPYYLMLSKAFINENKLLAERIWNTIATVRNSKKFIIKANEYLTR